MMLTANRKDITDAYGYGHEGNVFDSYESSLRSADKGFGLLFDDMSEVAAFFVRLGANAQDYEHGYSMRPDRIDTGDAIALADDCLMDTLSNSIMLYFPNWQLTP